MTFLPRGRGYSSWMMLLLMGLMIGVPVRAQETHPDYTAAIQQFIGTLDTSQYRQIFSDTVIPRDSLIPQSIVVETATLRVAGTVNGTILALDSDVYLDSTAVVHGDVVAINGWVTLQPGAEVSGIIRETTWETVFPATCSDEEFFYFPAPHSTAVSRKLGNRLLLRYNRAEGLFVGIQNWREYVENRSLNLFFQLGYGFASKAARFQLGIQRKFNLGARAYWDVGVAGYNRTDARDTWRLTELENSLTAFFFNEDYYDFYRTNGFALRSSIHFTPTAYLQGEYAEERYNTLPNRTDWAVWGSNKQFRPALMLGDYARFYRLWRLEGSIQTAKHSWNNDKLPLAQFQFWGEIAPARWNENWQYQRVEAEAKLTVPLSSMDRVRFRLRGGSSSGNMPIQRQFLLGGFSTLRGYRFNAFAGNRYILANVEYQIASDFIEDLLFGLDTDFVIFYDTGSAWTVDQNIAVWQLQIDQTHWYQDVGIGVGDIADGVRINIAKPLTAINGENDAFRVIVRIHKAF